MILRQLNSQTMTSMLFGTQQGMFHVNLDKNQSCKYPNRKAFLVCLEQMSAGSEEENDDSYLEYTKKWICAIDRGGLFRVNDEVYVLFYEIEKKVRQFLVNLVSHQSLQQDKEEIIKEIVTDDDIQCFWSMISIGIDQHVPNADCSTVANHTWVLNSWSIG